MENVKVKCEICEKNFSAVKSFSYGGLQSHVDGRHQIPVPHKVCSYCLGVVPEKKMKGHFKKEECSQRRNQLTAEVAAAEAEAAAETEAAADAVAVANAE